ncbi:hypothetical protein ACFX43_23350 [Nocardioides sp. YIM B13467]
MATIDEAGEPVGDPFDAAAESVQTSLAKGSTEAQGLVSQPVDR